MESRLTPIEDLPALYRAILDAVAELERRGGRAEAARIRSDATAAYSRSWDEVSRRRLDQLHLRARRSIETAEHGRFGGDSRRRFQRH
jgi:hypothetical protein